MTGEALYVKFTKAAAAANAGWNNKTDLGAVGCARRKTFNSDNESAVRPAAWPFLTDHDKRLWNDLARRLSPRSSR